MMDHHHSHHQIPVSISPVSFHDISRLQQNQIYHNPTSIVHETGTGNNIHGNNNNAHVGQNGNGDEVKPLVEKSKKAESVEKIVRYRECQKNHAANLGGLVTDGCGEFMPGGEEGTPEALRCAACECHRNFHRREVEGEEAQIACDVCYHKRLVPGSTLLPLSFPQAAMGVLARPLPQIIAAAPVNNNMKNSAVFVPSPESEEQADGNMPSGKKRFRTKFTHEQKERMLAFAQRVGWRLQKHEEAAVQSFCQEVGVRRHVLKVWMHNNKHAMATKPHADDNNHNNDNTAAANSSSNNSTP